MQRAKPLDNIGASPVLSNGAEKLSFPEDTFLIDETRDLIFIPIPKVACTSLKIWFLKSSPDIGIQPDPATWKVNAWLGGDGNRYLLKDPARLSDDRTFRFAFVRNPWSRLVSSYLNRIVGRGIEYRLLMKRLSKGRWYRWDKRAAYIVQKRISGQGWTDAKEVTFREFVTREVAVTPELEMDPHWRPQYTFLGPHRLDFLGRFEHLSEDLERLAGKIGISTELPELNRSQYVEQAGDECFADCPPCRLREMFAMPRYRQFYTADLVEEVARVYAQDLDRFGYEF